MQGIDIFCEDRILDERQFAIIISFVKNAMAYWDDFKRKKKRLSMSWISDHEPKLKLQIAVK